MLCSTCAPYSCDCGNTCSEFAYRVPGKLKTSFNTAEVGVCLLCKEKSKVDEGLCADCYKITHATIVCFDCLTNRCSECLEYTEYKYGKLCPRCHFEKRFDSKSEETVYGNCYMCKKLTDVIKGVCKSCTVGVQCSNLYCKNCGEVFVDPDGSRICTNCSKQLCLVCHTPVEPQGVGRLFCNEHQPQCQGCGAKFDPVDRNDKFCYSCYSSVSAGCCVDCATPTRHLDETGRCENCADPVGGVYYCNYCLVRAVSFPGEICSNCENKTHICPMCKDAQIPFNEYVCKKCLIARQKET